LTNISEKWAWSGSRDPVNFGALDANSSKTAEGTNFKFGRRVPRDSPDMSLTNVSEKWAWSRSRDPVNFGALDANSSKRAKGRNFKFGRHVPRDSPDMTPDKYFRKVGVVTVT